MKLNTMDGDAEEHGDQTVSVGLMAYRLTTFGLPLAALSSLLHRNDRV